MQDIVLSVIIPTRNRANMLKLALKSIEKQSLSQHCFETIVVDNGSTDETKEVVDSFVKNIPNLRYFYEETSGLHFGRHKGFKEARAEILVYTDDDIEAFPTWLEGIPKAFEDKDVVLVGGKTLPNFETEPPDWILDMWRQNGNGHRRLGYLSILDLGDNAKEINPYHVFGCNFSIRKSILLEAGGFHPDAFPQELIRFRGDGESHISNYIQSKGFKAIYNPKASVYHWVPKSRMTLNYFCHRAYLQGISDSFTRMRKDYGLGMNNRENKDKKVAVKDRQASYLNKIKVYRLLRRGANSIKHRAVRYKNIIFSTGYERIRISVEKGHRKGFVFHQNEAQRDPKLLEWIVRKNYMGENGKLPE